MPSRATLLHVDGAAGIAGDMCLGALLDLGVPLEHLREGLSRLGVPGWELSAERVTKGAVRAMRAHVRLEGEDDAHVHAHDHDHEQDHHHEHRSWPEIRRILERAGLSARVTTQSLAVFRRLCEAEAVVHGLSLDEVQLHEVGAVDAFVDIVGTCLGLEWLGVDRVSCSPPDLGGGTVRCRHGLLPVPAPATLELLKGRPVRTSGAEVELTTPTGAALLAELAEDWGTMPAMLIERIGWGAGSRDLADRANVVRFVLGREPESAQHGDEGYACVEADLDDADPQLLASFAAKALSLGALDCVRLPVLMKKGRGGTRVSILCRESLRPALIDALFAETTTIGCRWQSVERAECARETITVTTPQGPVRVKVATWQGRVVNARPEHDDCLAAAERAGVPLKTVLAAAAAEAHRITSAP